MQIGAGGLQRIATHEDIANKKAQEAQQRKPDGTESSSKERTTATYLGEEALNKAVDKLNGNARANNLPLEFAVKKEQEKSYIEMRNTSDGKTRELQPEDMSKLVRGMDEKTGLILDEFF